MYPGLLADFREAIVRVGEPTDKIAGPYCVSSGRQSYPAHGISRLMLALQNDGNRTGHALFFYASGSWELILQRLGQSSGI